MVCIEEPKTHERTINKWFEHNNQIQGKNYVL